MAKPKLTARQVLLMKGLVKGKTLTQSAIDAGYSENNPAQSGVQALNLAKKRIPDLMELYGLGPDTLIQKYLQPALEATETKFFAKDGEITDEVDVVAWGPRLTALDIAFNLNDSFPKNGKNGSGAIVNVEVIVEHITAANPVPA